MKITVPYFENLEVELSDDGDEGPQVLEAFLHLNSHDRKADSRHVFAYYRDFRSAVGGEDWLDEEMGVPQNPEDIWKHVSPSSAYIDCGLGGDEDCYLVLEAECDWDEEHGLMMVWRNGKQLCKVGEYDGHRTNEEAFADHSLSNVVYKASEDRFTTYLDV